MTEANGLTLLNSVWKSVRLLLILTGMGLAVSVVSGGLILRGGAYGSDTRSGVAAACSAGLICGGAFAFAFLISVLAAIWSAKTTDRAFARLLAGEMLADWHFPPREWDGFLQTEQASLSRGCWGLALLLGLPVMIVMGIPGFALADDTVTGVRNLILVVLAGSAVGGGAVFLRVRFIRRRIEELRRIPRVLIGENAVYCGGIFKPWNILSTVLRRIRIVPGPPMMLDVEIGPGQSAQTALRFTRGALAVTAALGGGGAAGAGIGPSNFISEFRVPVPAGKEEEAARIVDSLLHPAALHSPAVVAVPAAGTARSPLSAAPRPARGRRHRWWALTGVLLVTGFAMFLLAPSLAPPSPTGTGDPPLYTAVTVAGLLLWVAAGIIAILAVIDLLRGSLGRTKKVNGNQD